MKNKQKKKLCLRMTTGFLSDMVVGRLFGMTMPTDSHRTPLKFGMDRILANDAPHKKCKDNGCSGFNSKASHIPNLGLRCCPSTTIRISPPFYRTSTLLAPQPLRPYTNVLVRAESSAESSSNSNPNQKRKRSWSRAVFSNLQRKGLEKRFQLQKYITKPDRRQLAATLGLTDAQVKVWFQNRRMKWRHTKEGGGSREDSEEVKTGESSLMTADSTQERTADVDSDSDIDVQTVDCE